MIIFCRFEHSSLPTSIAKQKIEATCGTLIVSCNSNISHSLTCPKIYHGHVNLDLRHIGTKMAKGVWKTFVLKLLALVYPKYTQFRFKGKTFIIKKFHHLKFSRLEKKSCHSCLTKFLGLMLPYKCLRCLLNFKALRCGDFGGWYLKEGGTYFKVRGTIHMKFQNFVIFSFPNNNKQLPLRYIVLNISELLVTFTFL